MAGQRVAMIASMKQLFRSGPVSGLDDRQLLERFATRREEAAFAALVALHGPMVLGVCRRMLRDEHDVEDAFQATFLVLVKRAGSIRDPGRLGPWLHGVARRVAMRARAETARRAHRGRPGSSGIVKEATMRPTSPEDEELLGLIDEEVARLPARYRDAIILCDLEGRPYAEAARRLGCPLGTLQSRLARGRARLRARLVERGIAPMAVTVILAESARAAVPDAQAQATIRAATAGAVSASAAALAGPIARSLLMTKLKNVVGILILASIAMGGGLVERERLNAELPPPPAGAVPDPLPQPSRRDRSLNLEVVNGADHSAVAGATVWFQVNRGRPLDSQGTTDDEGRYPIAIPAGATSFLRVVVVHPGFAPIELRWAGEEPIPDAYTVALERGVPIGGTVRDEQGRPIAGARVHLQVGATPPRGGRERYPDPESEVAAAVTDAQGRWRSDALPASAGPGPRLELVMTHPDHVGLKRSVTAEALRAFAAAGVLETGRSLSGRVLSPIGRPVAGATVVVGSRSSGKTIENLQTDREGRFRTGMFIDPEWHEFTMAVRADGFAWAARTLLVPREIPPQDVRLSPRRPLHGRVIDVQGRPVPGAIVRSATEFGYAGLEWEAETDADGRFVWYEAPATGTYMLNVHEPPFRPILPRMIPGGSTDLTLTMRRRQRLHGTVTDAETGRPIERFVLISGRGPIRPGWQPEWNRNSPDSFGGGKFDLTGSNIDQDTYHSIRIEAEGYEPAEFIGYHDSQEDVAHDFKLRKAQRLAGVVRGPDGRPLAGVDVMLSGDGYQASITNGRIQRGSSPLPPVPAIPFYGSLRVRTGPDGRYGFSRQGHRVSVIAVHHVGIAIRSADELAVSTDLTLAPWARIEGMLKIGARPAPGEPLVARLLTPGFWGGVVNEIRTDESGRFVLDRVAPGRIWIYRRVDNQDKQGWRFSHLLYRDVKPGETVRLQVGGTGRPVVGRLAVPEGISLSHFALGHGALKPVLREPPTPDDFLDLDSERHSAWWETFSRTPEGRAYVEDRDRSYAVELRPDGAFRAEDVPPGRYILKLPFEGVSRGSREGRQALANAEVTVSERPGGRSDEPLDIGAVPLEVFSFHEPRLGEPAPTMVARMPDGRPLDLAALRGKLVLVHFWADQPGIAATFPHLKAMYDAFGRKPRFVMVGLCGGESPGPLRRYAAHHGLAGEQRYIGSIDLPNPFEAAFGIWFPPATFLISPDGRILAKDLQGEAIRQAVARALK